MSDETKETTGAVERRPTEDTVRTPVVVEQDVSKNEEYVAQLQEWSKKSRAVVRKIRKLVQKVLPEIADFKRGDREYVIQKAKEMFGLEYVEELLEKQDRLEEEHGMITAQLEEELAVPIEHEKYTGFVIKEVSDVRGVSSPDAFNIMTDVLAANMARQQSGKLPVRFFGIMMLAKLELREHGRYCQCANGQMNGLFDEEGGVMVVVEDDDQPEVDGYVVRECGHPVDGFKRVLEGSETLVDEDDILEVVKTMLMGDRVVGRFGPLVSFSPSCKP